MASRGLIPKTGDDRIDRAFNAISDEIRRLDIAEPDDGAAILTNVSVGTTATSINHLLARRLRGWQVVRLRGNAVVWDAQDQNQMQDRTLILLASAPVVVDLKVF
jgi:hypothetical protein